MDNSTIKFAFKKSKNSKNFNGIGNQRIGQYVLYGTYSQYQFVSGIYYIKNTITNMYYIGSSKNIGHRLSKHFSNLRKDKHPNIKLTNDYKKYGQDSFIFGILEKTDRDLLIKERDYQLKYNENELYNLQIKDTCRSEAQIYAAKHSSKESHKTPEYREKMRLIKSNRVARIDKKTLEILEIYENVSIAGIKCYLSNSTIMGACNGSKPQAGGYLWRYVDKNGNLIRQGKGRKRDIIEKLYNNKLKI